jgi:hypothetical protein
MPSHIVLALAARAWAALAFITAAHTVAAFTAAQPYAVEWR